MSTSLGGWWKSGFL